MAGNQRPWPPLFKLPSPRHVVRRSNSFWKTRIRRRTTTPTSAAPENGGDRSVPWFTWLGLLILTFNSGMAIVRSRGDVTAIAFVGFSYADLLALFACLRMYERAPAGSSTRGWLKVAVWVLTTLLTFAFSSKVAAVMPPTAAVLVWLMAFATVAGGFVAFFVYKEK